VHPAHSFIGIRWVFRHAKSLLSSYGPTYRLKAVAGNLRTACGSSNILRGLSLDQQISQCDKKQRFVVLTGKFEYNVSVRAKHHKKMFWWKRYKFCRCVYTVTLKSRFSQSYVVRLLEPYDIKQYENWCVEFIFWKKSWSNKWLYLCRIPHLT
jgi:hypothetical protein